MIKLTVLLFLCIKIAAGYDEEWTGYNSFPTIENAERGSWPAPIYYGEPQVQRKKPCPHKRNNAQAEEWVPTFRSLRTKPLNNNILQPQALKNDYVENIANDKTSVPDNLPAETSPNNEYNTATNSDKARNTNGTYRRSNSEESLNNREEPSPSEDYDCDIDLDTEDYFDFQNGKGQFSAVTSEPTAKTTAGIERKVIEMLKDCINKKQKYIEGKLNQLEDIPLAGSRRSMGGSDNDNDASEAVDEQTTTDTNTETDAIIRTIDDKTNADVPSVHDKVKKIPQFTLRSGKLFNELQNPTKTTGLAEFPVSRRMPTDGTRICYACSTATNPSCWNPDSKTTVKYCRTGQNCVTKSMGNPKTSLTILRDCAVSCESTSVAGIETKYASCSVCHKDLCNSAAIKSYNLIIIFIITATKCILYF